MATIERVSLPPPIKRSTFRPGKFTSPPKLLLPTQKQGITKGSTTKRTTLAPTNPYPTRTTTASTRARVTTTPTNSPWATSSSSVIVQGVTKSKLPMTSLIGGGNSNDNRPPLRPSPPPRPANIITLTGGVPGGPYTKMLFDKFVSKLTQRGLIRKIPVRNVKIVFFNLLAAIGQSTNENRNQELLYKYLEHFNRNEVDNKRRFGLNDKDFKNTSELLDRLVFNYLSDTYAGTNDVPRPNYPTTTTSTTTRSTTTRRTTRRTRPTTTTTRLISTRRPTLKPIRTWRPSPRPPSTTSIDFALPPLEPVTQVPHRYSTSTTTFGGVASNTVKPTTKSMLAEMEFPSNYDRPKYQFMHDPDKSKGTFTTTTTFAPNTTPSLPSASELVSIWNIIKTSTTPSPSIVTPESLNQFGDKLESDNKVDFVQLSQSTLKPSTRSTTTTASTRPMPSFYPQLIHSDPSFSGGVKEFPGLRPNFNNEPTTTAPPFDFDQFINDQKYTQPTTPKPPSKNTLSSPVNSNLSANQWNQILHKLNFALEKLSKLEETTKSNPTSAANIEDNDEDVNILGNPHYIKKNPHYQQPSNGVEINVLSLSGVKDYDDQNNSNQIDDINYEDYFQAIADVELDNLNLNYHRPKLSSPSSSSPAHLVDDYVYFNDEIIDKFFDLNLAHQHQVPSSSSSDNRPLDLPGVGSKNPVPLSNFPSDSSRQDYPHIDLGKYPVGVPIPLTEADRLGLSVIPQKLRPQRPTNIGTRKKSPSIQIGSKTRLVAPGVIKEVFGPPLNLSDMRASIPDFTSSGPVNIPSPLQLYGNIGKYLNNNTGSADHGETAIRPSETETQFHNYLSLIPNRLKTTTTTVRPVSKPFANPAFLAALIDLLEGSNDQIGPAHLGPHNHDQFDHALDHGAETLRKPSTLTAAQYEKQPKDPYNLAYLQGGLRKPSSLANIDLQEEPLAYDHHSSSQNPPRLYNKIGAYLTPKVNPHSAGGTHEYEFPGPKITNKPKQYGQQSSHSSYKSGFRLPSGHGALKKPQSLANLEANNMPVQPVPIKWLEDRQSLSYGGNSNHHRQETNVNYEMKYLPYLMQQMESRSRSSMMSEEFPAASASSSSPTRFKTPPVIVPLEPDNQLGSGQILNSPSSNLYQRKIENNIPPRKDPQFTILTPQQISPPSTRVNVPFHSSMSKDHLFDMVLRHQALPNRRRRKRASDFVLKPPKHFEEDTMLKPEDAVVAILQNRPDLTTTTTTSTSTTSTTVSSTTKRTILSKPSAIESEELSLAKPLSLLNINQITAVQTSLLGIANPLSSSTSSGSITYNKLLMAAAMSVVPTLAIAFPFLAAGKKKRKK